MRMTPETSDGLPCRQGRVRRIAQAFELSEAKDAFVLFFEKRAADVSRSEQQREQPGQKSEQPMKRSLP